MPSPFKRHGSRQIQPMSQAELDASLAELERQALEDEQGDGIYITRDPADATGNKWLALFNAHKPADYRYQEGFPVDQGVSHEEAERRAKQGASKMGIPYLGER